MKLTDAQLQELAFLLHWNSQSHFYMYKMPELTLMAEYECSLRGFDSILDYVKNIMENRGVK